MMLEGFWFMTYIRKEYKEYTSQTYFRWSPEDAFSIVKQVMTVCDDILAVRASCGEIGLSFTVERREVCDV